MHNADFSSLVHRKERIYYAVLVIVSLLVYAGIGTAIASGDAATLGAASGVLLYVGFFALLIFMMHALALGAVRGNAVRVSKTQFPELLEMAKRHAEAMQLAPLPDIFVLQSGGVLNAFAAKLMRRHLVVINSDVLALAESRGAGAVSFIVGHELAHVKRGHLKHRWLTAPGRMVPYLGSAYSRACEFTCDRFGLACEPEGAIDGLLVLAAGRDLYPRVNVREFARQVETENGFWVKRAEWLSSHPRLPRRVSALLAAGAKLPVAAASAPAYRPGTMTPIPADM